MEIRASMNNPLVSVIIPVYNQKKYLDDCLKSMVAQVYNNLEIILIDDGSNDGSQVICDTWKKIDSRIQVFHVNNGGVSRARNIGLMKSAGDLIYFVDPDDWIDSHTISRMVNIMISCNVDLVFAQYNELYSIGKSNKVRNGSVHLYNQEKIIQFILEGEKLTNHIWRGMYKKKLIKPNIFPVGRNYEDMYSILEFVRKCNEIALVDEVLYHHRLNDKSITHTWDLKNCMDLCEATQHESRIALSLYPELKPIITYKIIRDILYVWNNAVRSDMQEKELGRVLAKLNNIFNEFYSNVQIPLNTRIQMYLINKVKIKNKLFNRIISAILQYMKKA